MSPGPEDRRYVRRPLYATVTVRDAGEPNAGAVLFDAVDISLGGAFLQSELLLEVGDEVEITFAIPDEMDPIHVRAKVAWATRANEQKGTPGMGLQFLDLTDSDRERIANYIAKHRDAE